MSHDLERLVAELDERPATVDELVRALAWEESVVRYGLSVAEEAGLAVCWGQDVWATTWRAKLAMSPGFFETWLPGSLAIGLALTAVAASLHGPAGSADLAIYLSGLAVLAAGVAVWRKKTDREG